VPVALTYLLICLTTFSLTRLIIKDSFPPIATPRDWILNWFEPDGEWQLEHPDTRPHLGPLGRSLAYLLTCPWCMSIWIGALVVYGFTWFVSVPLPVVAVIVARAVTGLIAVNLDPDD
jgi:hypothetical protein